MGYKDPAHITGYGITQIIKAEAKEWRDKSSHCSQTDQIGYGRTNFASFSKLKKVTRIFKAVG